MLKEMLPIGIDDFEKIRKNGYYYVDKTLIKYEQHTCDFSRELGSWSCFLCFDLV